MNSEQKEISKLITKILKVDGILGIICGCDNNTVDISDLKQHCESKCHTEWIEKKEKVFCEACQKYFKKSGLKTHEKSQTHLKKAGKLIPVSVECECGEKIEESKLNKHRDTNKHKENMIRLNTPTRDCECKKPIPISEYEEHLEKCPKQKITCPCSTKDFYRSTFPKHCQSMRHMNYMEKIKATTTLPLPTPVIEPEEVKVIESDITDTESVPQQLDNDSNDGNDGNDGGDSNDNDNDESEASFSDLLDVPQNKFQPKTFNIPTQDELEKESDNMILRGDQLLKSIRGTA